MTNTKSNTPSKGVDLQKNINGRQVKIREETVSSVKENLEATDLTIDQKIDQLTAQVQNLASGVSGLMDVMRMMMGKQIEQANELQDIAVKARDIDAKTDKSLSSITDIKKNITDNQLILLNEHNNTIKKLERIVENQRVLAQWIQAGLKYSLDIEDKIND